MHHLAVKLLPSTVSAWASSTPRALLYLAASWTMPELTLPAGLDGSSWHPSCGAEAAVLYAELEASAYIRLELEPGHCTETHYLHLQVTLCWIG